MGNKSDLKLRQVSREEGEDKARQLGVHFLETSALEDMNIQ